MTDQTVEADDPRVEIVAKAIFGDDAQWDRVNGAGLTFLRREYYPKARAAIAAQEGAESSLHKMQIASPTHLDPLPEGVVNLGALGPNDPWCSAINPTGYKTEAQIIADHLAIAVRALEPFAKAAERYSDEQAEADCNDPIPDSEPVAEYGVDKTLLAGHFRGARQALAAIKGST